MKTPKTYAAAKSQHISIEMNKGVPLEKARRSWSHGKDTPRSKWIAEHLGLQRQANAHNGVNLPDGDEWSDFAHTSDDL